MHTTMNVTGDFIFLWYVIVPTLILVLAAVLSLSRDLVVRLRRGWNSFLGTLRPTAAAHGHGPRWTADHAET